MTEVVSSPRKVVRFYALGDFGYATPELKQVAQAMNQYAEEGNAPDFILGLGDLIYPCGVDDINDEAFTKVWKDIFLKYDHLRVPWRNVLGNHDYQGNYLSEIEYHYSKEHNAEGLWYMPDTCYDFQIELDKEFHGNTVDVQEPKAKIINTVQEPGLYSVKRKIVSEPKTIDPKKVSIAEFHAFDTNGCQGHVLELYPHMKSTLIHSIQTLHRRLKQSTADWKIVYAHHPIYTQSLGHGRTAKVLRSSGKEGGFNFEQVLIDGQIDVYITGHEHVMQYHCQHGIHHVCSGASGADQRPGHGLYQGKDTSIELDFVGDGSQIGFASFELTAHQMIIRFVGVKGQIYKEVIINR